MADLQELKSIFKANMIKVAKKLGKNIQDIKRDEYRDVVKQLNLPKEDGKSIGGYKKMLFELVGSKDLDNVDNFVDYNSIFKESLLQVSAVLNKSVIKITRDEYISVSRQNNIEVLSKHRLHEMGGFVVLKNTIFKEDVEKESKRNYILKEFKEYVIENISIPTINEFKKICDLKNMFNSIEELEQEALKVYPEINDYVFNESSFTPSYRKELEENMKKYKRFVITTAVSDKKVHKPFLESLINYSEQQQAMVLILPCEDVASRRKAHKWNMDPQLKKFNAVFNDLYLNENLCLCTIKTSAKQIQPIQGLDRLVERKNASLIIASTKQFLKYIPNSPNKIPHALMTTGAVTISDYSSDLYMSHRTSTIAENDHMVGAIVVELQDNNIFHFRQLQASKSGSIADLGVEYFPNGKVKKCEDTVLVFGDSHVGMHDTELTKRVCSLIPKMTCNTVVLHDLLNSNSVSHHDLGKIAIKSAKANKGESSLEEEGKVIKNYLDEISSLVSKVYVVKSNHDEHLDRYLTEGRFINDPINFYFSLDLVKKLIEGDDPLKYMMEEKIGLKNTNITWLKLDESFKKHGIEMGIHGHNGANGSKGSPVIFEKGVGNAITAHTHGAFVFRTVFGVGTCSNMSMGYNNGLSSWTRTCALAYKNGTKQLINFIPYKGNYEYTIVGEK